MSRKVDFDEVEKNIEKQDLDIRFIRIVYEGLTLIEFKKLEEKRGAIKLPGEGRVLAQYPLDSKPLFKEKAVEIRSLEA